MIMINKKIINNKFCSSAQLSSAQLSSAQLTITLNFLKFYVYLLIKDTIICYLKNYFLRKLLNFS